MDEKMKELLEDKVFVENLMQQETPEQVKDLLGENGVEVTVDDIKQAIDIVSDHPDGVLGEAELENVSGGCAACVILLIATIGTGFATAGIQARRMRW